MSQSPVKILITGGGIAGPALAYWLTRTPTRTPLSITILERSPEPRLTGQSVDIREAGVGIMQRMGIEPAVRACRTPERGIHRLSGTTGRILATFMETGNTKQQSMTSEYEILRADLARVCTDAASARPGVRFVYGDYVSSVSQDAKGGKVRVEFTNGKLLTEDYDLVVGADGVRSRMRPFVTGRPAGDDLHSPWNVFTAYFTIPRRPGDSDDMGWQMSYPRSRSLLLRPSPAGVGAYFTVVREDAALDAAVGQDVDAQKRAMAAAFEDVPGVHVARTLEGMAAATDFYFERVSQVKAPCWHSGRVTLVGDAGYCPAPISGMGTSTALYGAYVLAGELISAFGEKGDGDVPASLAQYERTMQPFITEVQNVPNRAPGIMHPYSVWGVQALDAFAWLVDALKIVPIVLALLALMPESTKGVTKKVPEYAWAPA
jgi:2-polyprenyl-6-methoxyphenol hydroxylase-like FAD-dependent oxidoreductase